MTEFSFFCGGGWTVPLSLAHTGELLWAFFTNDASLEFKHTMRPAQTKRRTRESAPKLTDTAKKKKKKIGSCTRWQGSDDEQLQDLLSKTGSPLTQVHLGSFKKAYIVQCVWIIPMKTRVNQAPRTSSLAGTHLSLEVHHLSRISSTLSRQKLTDCSSSAIFLSRTTPERVLSEALHQLAETLVAFL